MKQIIWSCWFQGIENAPNLVQRCLGSWQDLNPDWEMRILDAETIRYYFDIDEIIDLQRKQIRGCLKSRSLS